MFFSSLSLKTKVKNTFYSFLENKRKNIILLSKEIKVILLKVLFSSWKRISRLLCCEKIMVFIFIVPFITWGDKISQWNNHSGFLSILESNLKVLFFVTLLPWSWRFCLKVTTINLFLIYNIFILIILLKCFYEK